jgi:hypothetical protein
MSIDRKISTLHDNCFEYATSVNSFEGLPNPSNPKSKHQGEARYATHNLTLTQGSLRGGVPLLNGGSGGRSDAPYVGFPEGLAHQDNPQIRVLSTLVKLATHKFSSPTALLSTNNHNRGTI